MIAVLRALSRPGAFRTRSTAVRWLQHSVLEVERKFLCDARSSDLLNKNSGEPPFRVLEYLGRHTFEDTYYDHGEILSSLGIWVRRRGGKWEAKIRQGGDYTNSQFEELSQPHEIAQMMRDCNIEPSAASDAFGLRTTAKFTTIRESWKADEQFGIVIDSTDFGHYIGEVELQQKVEQEDGANPDYQRALRQATAAKMDSQIEAFMAKYSWAFPSGKPIGKLSAYFDREKSMSDGWLG